MDKNRKSETKINIGKKGLTKAILREIKNRHIKYEIIKVKVLKSSRNKFDEIVNDLKKEFKVYRIKGFVIEILGEKYGRDKFSKTRSFDRKNSRKIKGIR